MIHNNHSTTSIALHHFDSMKWKRRLYNISHKLHRSHNNNNHHRHWNAAAATSATAMAAATEKFITTRHSAPTTTSRTPSSSTTPSSSVADDEDDIAIHSEDLTASQFANLTGIKTKRNHQQHSIYHDLYEDSSSEEEEYEDDDEDSRDYYYSSTPSATTSSSSAHHHHRQPAVMRIWDSHFWQDHPQGRKSLPISILTNSTTSMKEISSSTFSTTTKLSSQPLTRHISEPGRSSSSSTTRASAPSVIQKGRFKIVWGGQEEEEQDINNNNKLETHCVEWKRKRAGSNSSA